MNHTAIFTRLMLTGLMMAGVIHLWSQGTVTGTVIDGSTGDVIPGANVSLKNQEKGTVTGLEGRFDLNVPAEPQTLVISYIGYRTLEIPLFLKHNEKKDLGTITLEGETLELKGVDIISSFSRERVTPYAMSTIRADMINREIGMQDYPAVMKMVPGVYVSREGGGTGDDRLSIRGFQQENVAILLNGVPVGSVENGLLYWSNWTGLADATQAIQVQKGLGASKVAVNSVGGTINIITKTTEAEKGGTFRFTLSDYGNYKTSLSLSTGKLPGGYAVTFLGSMIKGPGYVDATYVDGWSYFLSVGKDIGRNHQLVFTALGSPEHHGQNTYKMTVDEYNKYGNKYNYAWGSYNGRINTLTENFYHKPELSLNEYWNISPRSFLATSVYFSFGYGGGKWTESFYGPSIYTFRNPSGQIDWGAVYEYNVTNPDSVLLADGRYIKGYSRNIQTHFLADHYWYGLLSTYKHEFGSHFDLLAGIHARHFKSRLYEKVWDLLGGQYWIEDYAWAVDGVAGRNEIRTVGDVIKLDNSSIVDYTGTFGQLEYSGGIVSAFVAGTLSNTWYQREDRYNYVSDINSRVITQGGADAKAGINFNINEFNRLYLNTGFYSKEPYFQYIFVNFTNVPVRNIKNEKIKAFEVGYGYKHQAVNIDLNAYYTVWQDKSLLSNENIQLADSTMTRAMIRGLDALHTGVELEINARPWPFLNIGINASAGNWKWKNNVVAELYNEDNVLIDTTRVYADGLYVGGAPQTQVGLYAGLDVTKTLNLRANWLYYDRLWADFDPASRNDPLDHRQPYRLPAYDVLDLYMTWQFVIADHQATFEAACFNVGGKAHILDGDDGPGHDEATFRGFWSFGRTFSFGIAINF